jgi:hypothetical protein
MPGTTRTGASTARWTFPTNWYPDVVRVPHQDRRSRLAGIDPVGERRERLLFVGVPAGEGVAVDGLRNELDDRLEPDDDVRLADGALAPAASGTRRSRGPMPTARTTFDVPPAPDVPLASTTSGRAAAKSAGSGPASRS